MDMCRLLLDNNSDVNSALNSGDTPLHRASYMGHSDVVRLGNVSYKIAVILDVVMSQ